MKDVIINLKFFFKLLQDKKYDDIYTNYGNIPYILFADLKYKKNDIKKLVEDNNYKILYEKYGVNEPFISKVYKKHINNLISKGNYMDIINIYDYSLYNKNKFKIIKSGIIKESGSIIKANKELFKEFIKESIMDGLKYSYILLITLNILIAQFRVSAYNDSIKDNVEILETYNNKNEKYSNYIKSLNIDNDLDIVMKIIYDMWNEMDGYGEPKYEALGIPRIAFANLNGSGVCRNIADDFSARLNSINPEYNAGTLAVKANFEYYDKLANIERKYSNDYYVDEDEETKSINLIGNHMVSFFKPIGKNYYLVVDPTNPVIGIIVNGKIYIFSNKDGKGLDFKFLGQALISLETNYTEIQYEFMKSFILHTNIDEIDALNDIWGLDAQNKSIEKIKKLNK